MKNKQIIVGVILIFIFVFAAFAAPYIVPNNPNSINMGLKNAPPSAEFPFGNDALGRCEFSRVIYGARYSLIFAIPVTMSLAVIALFVGSFIAYKGGIVDTILGILCDIFMAFPLIVIAISLVNIIDGGMMSIVISLSIATITWFLRMIRSYTKTERDKSYIECLKISGASDFRIVLTHIIPNVLPQYIVYVTTNIAAVIIGISSFSFLGVGYEKGTPEWGAMLSEAINSIYTNPTLILYPGLCIILCCAGFNLLGEGLRDSIGKENNDSVL